MIYSETMAATYIEVVKTKAAAMHEKRFPGSGPLMVVYTLGKPTAWTRRKGDGFTCHWKVNLKSRSRVRFYRQVFD